MRGLTIVTIGAITCIFGMIFHLQGQAMVGPESSFMYANPEWENYGIQIAVVGAAILVIGIVIKLKNK